MAASATLIIIYFVVFSLTRFLPLRLPAHFIQGVVRFPSKAPNDGFDWEILKKKSPWPRFFSPRALAEKLISSWQPINPTIRISWNLSMRLRKNRQETNRTIERKNLHNLPQRFQTSLSIDAKYRDLYAQKKSSLASMFSRSLLHLPPPQILPCFCFVFRTTAVRFFRRCGQHGAARNGVT